MKEKLKVAIGYLWPILLCAVFVTLKLTHLIAWSWWWVLCPVWIPLAIAAIAFVIIIFLVGRH